jgi:hypothetical protein
MKAISCIYNLRCDSPFSSHKKAKFSLIPTFPYLYIFIFLYFYISVSLYLDIFIFLYFYISISLYLNIFIFPYLYIYISIYIFSSPRKNHLQKVPPSIHSRSAKLRRNPDAGFSDILVSGCSRTRRMIWPDIAQNPTTPKQKNKQCPSRAYGVYANRPNTDMEKPASGFLRSLPPHTFPPCTTPPSML